MVHQAPPPEPTAEEIEAQLGSSFAAWEALLGAHPDLRPEWKWYGPKNGWTLKLFDGKRNLCFLSPGDGRFLAAFVLGHDAVERALKSTLPPELRREIAGARTYPEGRPARIEVRAEEDLGPVHTLLEIKRGGTPGRGRQSRSRGQAPAAGGHHAPTSPAAGRTPSQRRGRSPG